jgi:hypothetical protein
VLQLRSVFILIYRHILARFVRIVMFQFSLLDWKVNRYEIKQVFT